MGGAVIAEAARLMPGRVAGLIGIDTLHNIEYPMTREELSKMLDRPKEFNHALEKAIRLTSQNKTK